MLKFPGKDFIRRQLANRYGRFANCLFVLSTGRAGTTMLAHLMEITHGVQAEHEPFPLYLKETCDAWHQFPDRSMNFPSQFATSRMRVLCRNRYHEGLYAECSNRLTYVAYELRDHFPNAKFIHLYRDPADVVRSIMRRKYYTEGTSEKSDWGRYRITPRDSDPAIRLWDKWTPFQKCCWYWAAINQYSINFVNDSGERAQSLNAEDFFHNRNEEYSSLCNWLGLNPPASDEIQQLLAKPANSQVSGEFDTWNSWSIEQRKDLIDIAGETAVRLGYDKYQSA